MKTIGLTRISGLALVGFLTLTGGTVLGFGPPQHAGSDPIEGTWLSEVKIVPCPPAPSAVIITFQSMTTYIAGGTLVEGGATPGPPPAVSRSAGHGIWERAGRHTLLVFLRFHSFDNLGRRVGITEVTTHPKLIRGDNPETTGVVEPYYLSGDGTNRTTNLNPVDGTVINVTEGCSKATSAPFLFRD